MSQGAGGRQSRLSAEALGRIEASLQRLVGSFEKFSDDQVDRLQAIVAEFLQRQANWEERLMPAELRKAVAPFARVAASLKILHDEGSPVPDLQQQARRVLEVWNALSDEARDAIRNRWAGPAPGNWDKHCEAAGQPFDPGIDRHDAYLPRYFEDLAYGRFDLSLLDELTFKLADAARFEPRCGRPRLDPEHLFIARLDRFWYEITGKEPTRQNRYGRWRRSGGSREWVAGRDAGPFLEFVRAVVAELPSDRRGNLHPREEQRSLEERVRKVLERYAEIRTHLGLPVRGPGGKLISPSVEHS